MPALAANARMYAVNPAVEEAWRRLFDEVSRAADIPLRYVEHPAPKPLDELWARDDLGLAFMCGWPFAHSYPEVQPVAAPVPAEPRLGGGARYRTDLVVDATGRFRTLAETFGGRIGWTAEHSQSGYHAVRGHLAELRGGAGQGDPYSAWLGPLLTPRRVVEAVLVGEVEVGPLDGYWHELLKAHEPETARRLRVVASTEPRPMPLLVAAAGIDAAIVARLREALVSLRASSETLASLRLSGFAPANRADYDVLRVSGAAVEPAGAAP